MDVVSGGCSTFLTPPPSPFADWDEDSDKDEPNHESQGNLKDEGEEELPQTGSGPAMVPDKPIDIHQGSTDKPQTSLESTKTIPPTPDKAPTLLVPTINNNISFNKQTLGYKNRQAILQKPRQTIGDHIE